MAYVFHLTIGGFKIQEYWAVQFTRLITLPLLHALWTGILGYFIALGVQNRKLIKGLFLAGRCLMSILHGLYDTFTFSESFWEFIIAFIAVIIFVGYIRSSASMQEKIKNVSNKMAG